MRINEDEFLEWHEHVLKQRNTFRRVLEKIVMGVPRIPGMASDYRKPTLKEVIDMAKQAIVAE